MKHTPGPWVARKSFVGRLEPDHPDFDCYNSLPYSRIMSTDPEANDVVGFNYAQNSVVMSEADACLIAAAPELLNAVQSALIPLERIAEEQGELAVSEDVRVALTLIRLVLFRAVTPPR